MQLQGLLGMQRLVGQATCMQAWTREARAAQLLYLIMCMDATVKVSFTLAAHTRYVAGSACSRAAASSLHLDCPATGAGSAEH